MLSRLYNPEAFGTLAVFISLASLLTSVGSWRYELAIPLPAQSTVAANLLVLCLVVVALMGAVVSLFVLFAAGSIAGWLNCIELAPYLWLLPAAFVGGSAYQVLGAWALRHEAFEEIARTRVSQSCGMVGTQLALGAAGIGAVGLLAGDVLGRITGVGVLARFAWRNFPTDAVSLAGMLAALRQYVKFPILSSPASLLTSLSTQLPLLLLVRFFGPAVGGLFVLTTRVLGMPAALLGQAVGQTLLARAARIKTDEAQVRRLTHRTAIGMFAVGVVVFGLVAVGGPGLFAAAFGREWTQAGLYARMLAPWYLLWLVCNPLSNLLNIREWQSTTLLFSALECAVQVAAIMIGARLGSQVEAIALLGAAASVLALVTMGRFFRAGYTSTFRVFRRMAVPLAGVLVSLAALLCLLRGPGLAQTAIRIGIFMLICGLLEWRFRVLQEALKT
ncbi:MAG TPA: oligosaccharide flippase family protein [Bryobacteraceae bacterium]|nr:oligosaccharide flippase family protein [Bryobacteraceae bacterium]